MLLTLGALLWCSPQALAAVPDRSIRQVESTSLVGVAEVIEVQATAYCPCHKCCGKTDKITYTGKVAKRDHTIAVDPKVIPLGSRVYIEGLGIRYAEDIGGAIKNKRIDIYMDSHEAALAFGVQKLKVYVMKQ